MAVSTTTTTQIYVPYTRGMIRARGGAVGIVSIQGNILGDATGGGSTVTISIPAAQAQKFLWRVMAWHLEFTAQGAALDINLDVQLLWRPRGTAAFTITVSNSVLLPGNTITARHPRGADLRQFIGLIIESGGAIDVVTISTNENALQHSSRIWLEQLPLEAEAPFTGRHTER